jgi:hypothetical protein
MEAAAQRNETTQPWDAIAVREDPITKKTYWTKVGKAFLNTDGSYNIFMDALPLTGKLQIRPHKEFEPRVVPPELPLVKR